jgi:mRNA-degrading endonuclease toxin of MazEF toxin-antitoxin module
MLTPGDVVLAWLPGAQKTKRRTTVVVSTDLYQSQGRDVVLAELTTQLDKATRSTDYLLQDWAAAGLHYPSAFRVYLGTLEIRHTRQIGHLTDRDWREVQARLRFGLAVS